ncbi:MAG: hypothetical protein ACD_12C00578G0001 [uncultured bacterium]|nr:MAG: hypothetical protein ACD_12C00578G0001 [uncultured bacterium]
MNNPMQWFQDLNQDQFDSLSKFYIDLAKAAFVFAVFSPATQDLSTMINKILAIFATVVLLSTGMLLLKMKQESI